MLAAAPAEQTRTLQLFNLALSIVGSGSKDVPVPLATYFDKVLMQARGLASDPLAKRGELLPEAIQIALDMRNDRALEAVLLELHSIADMKPEQAQRIISSLGKVFATGN